MNCSAIFSSDRVYRYSLLREWDHTRLRCAFVMLNPSTADETQNDPTVERCQRRAIAMGYGGLVVANIFALRSTDPRELYRHTDPVGPSNDASIERVLLICPMIVCAWGNHGALHDRGRTVLERIISNHHNVRHLGMTKAGQPRHPLYVGYDVQPQAFA